MGAARSLCRFTLDLAQCSVPQLNPAPPPDPPPRSFICYERDDVPPSEQLSLFPAEHEAGVSYFDVLVKDGQFIKKENVRGPPPVPSAAAMALPLVR